MEIEVKTFEELSKIELYAVLQLRSEVFVVEQDCAYQDLDGSDQKALHVLGSKGGRLMAYARIFWPGDYFENASIGRIVVRASERKSGLGKQIVWVSASEIENRYACPPIELSAQTYLVRFYNGLGFHEFGNEYLEDGIPHIRMLRSTK